MTGALIYHVASGQAFFSGVASIHLASLLGLARRSRGRSLARTALAALGLLLVAASATPLPAPLYAAAGTATLAWLVLESVDRERLARYRRPLALTALGLWWVGLALELPYHLMPRLAPMGHPVVAVVGDSITAGMGGEAETWPKILARRHRVEVLDLSLAGATAATAFRDQGPRVPAGGSLVVTEIGGNDILGDTPPGAFEASLDRLLARLNADGNTVVMLELPLPPSYNGFGAVQRRLARRHGVLLVPKRVLVGVLVSPGATVDSIHLTRARHGQMAEAVWRAIRHAFTATR